MIRRSAFDAVSLAMQHVRQQILPFRWSQWWRLAVLGLLTAEITSGGCGMPPMSGPVGPLPGEPSQGGSWGADPLAWLDEHLLVVIASVIAIVVVTGLLMLLWTYVNSITRFILIDTVVARRCDGIRAGWRKWRGPGRQFFVWQLVYQLVTFLAVVLLIAAFAIPAVQSGYTATTVVLVIACACSLLGLAIAAAVVYVIGKDFMAPILAIERNGFRAAWRTLLGIMREDKGGFAAYIGVKILMSLVAGVLLMIVFLILMLPVILGGFAVAAAIEASGIVWTDAMIAVGIAVLGLFLTLLLVVGLSAVSIPFTIFFPAYGLHFLSPRYPPLDAWLTPPATAGT